MAERGILPLGHLWGVPIAAHPSLFLAIGLYAIESGAGLWDSVSLLVVGLTAITIHECGHVLAARACGEQYRRVTLYPFGGVHEGARVTSSGTPRSTRRALIAISGPAMSLTTSALLYTVFFHILELPFVATATHAQLVVVNAWLGGCNLIPVDPLDSGRIGRLFSANSFLALRIGQTIAVMVAVLLLVSGELTAGATILGAVVYSFRMFFVEHARRAASAYLVRDVMRSAEEVDTLAHGMRVSDALGIALRSWQDLFPVLLRGEVIGVIDRGTLLKARATQEEEEYITGIVIKEYPTTSPGEPLTHALERLQLDAPSPILVLDGTRFVGMVATSQLLEVLLVDTLHEPAPGSNLNTFPE